MVVKKKLNKKNIYFFRLILSILIFLQINIVQSFDQLAEAIKKDDVGNFEAAYLALELYPDFICCINGKSLQTLLTYSIRMNAEKIALNLIGKGAKINLLSDTKNKYSSLAASLESNCSLELCKKLIVLGANIAQIMQEENVIYSLFDFLSNSKVSFEKKQFIVQYLMSLYGKNVLEIALSKKCSLKSLVFLIENGAHIPNDICKIATECKAEQQIIDFFEYYFEMKEKLFKDTEFPVDIIYIINEYAAGIKSGTQVETKKQLQAHVKKAILNNDQQFIQDYIKKGGDLNLIIEDNSNLLCLALKHGKKEIADLLIENNGLFSEDDYLKAISYAFGNKKIPLSLMIKILNIKNIVPSFTINIRLVWMLKLKLEKQEVNEKTRFIFDFLLMNYAENLLEFMFKNSDFNIIISLDLIKYLVECGAKVDREIIDIAEKLNISSDIIEYLNNLIEMIDSLKNAKFELSASVTDIINQYAHSQDIPKKKDCIIC